MSSNSSNLWNTPASVNFHQYPNAPLPSTLMQNGMSSEKQNTTEEAPPPIPQRSNSLFSPYSNLGSYGNPYSSPYQSYMYGGNTGGLYGYSSFGSPMFQNNQMLSGIENASQNAFQSAQTFIGAFSSVSMMLESTLFAVQNSVRAVAGVADQFEHLRNHMISISNGFMRILKHYLRKLMCLFRLQQPEQHEERFWQDAIAGKSSKEESKVYASLLFFTVLIATPWFIWKLLKALNSEQQRDNKWFKGSGEHFLAEVKFSFTARSSDELTLSPNTIIRLAPKSQQPNIRGWLLAADDERQGLIPANYVKILGKNRKKENNEEASTKENLEKIYEIEERQVEEEEDDEEDKVN